MHGGMGGNLKVLLFHLGLPALLPDYHDKFGLHLIELEPTFPHS